MYKLVLDTETAGSLDTPYIYDLGYTIYNTIERCIVEKGSFIVEEVWYNKPLYRTAYYYDKRELYVNKLKGRKTQLKPLKEISREIRKVLKRFEIKEFYAYNSSFDARALKNTFDVFGLINPFEHLQDFCIMNIAYTILSDDAEYLNYCDENAFYTDRGSYKLTAESVYSFLINEPNYKEEHTALEDAIIETAILDYCIHQGAEVETILPRKFMPKSAKANTNTFIEVYRGKELLDKLECVIYNKARGEKNTFRAYLRF